MKKRTLGFFASIFVGIAIIALAFNVVTAPQNQPPLNVIVENTPLPVEVTNQSGLPIATNCTRAYIGQSYTGGALDSAKIYNAQAHEGLGGKTVVFTGGGVSGGVVFSSDNGAGGAPGLGNVHVYNTELEVTQFALPLNSMLRIEDVDIIKVFASACYPKLTGTASYYVTVEATVNWYIEEG